MTHNILSLENVSHRFSATGVLRNVSIGVEEGEIACIVGPSGCGKTTILNLMSGFYCPGAGKVVKSGSSRMLYQENGLFPWMTVADNIGVGLTDVSSRREKKCRVDELLDLVGLCDFARHYPYQLSGGMRRLVELARVLAGNADILLMDEPFSALDYQTRLLMLLELVRILKARPLTVVLVTHDIEEAALLADRIFILSERPACVRDTIALSLGRPRHLAHPIVVDTITRVLRQLATRDLFADSESRSCFALNAADTSASAV